MLSTLVSALLGAIVAFAGTYLLQRRQFRRADLEGVRERLGLTRALRADLFAAKLLIEVSLKNEHIVAGSAFPSELWASHGHRLIAALQRPAEVALIDVFSRFAFINGFLAARPLGEHTPLNEGPFSAIELQTLIDKITTGIEVLDKLEAQCEVRAFALRFPCRHAWRRVRKRNRAS